MYPDLYDHLSKAYHLLQELLKDFPVNNNPLEYVLAPFFHEQQVKLWEAMYLHQQSSLSKKHFREIISVLYRSNEAFNPTYRAWIAASTWMESIQPDIYKKVASDLKDQPALDIPSIHQTYGKFDTRYIIPPLSSILL